MPNTLHYQQARAQFDQYVVRARLADLWGHTNGHVTDLVRFQDIAQQLGARQQMPRGIQSVPLDRIVGSVGRTHDFTRSFLPRASVNRERWAGIAAATYAFEGLPPVDLYQLGEVYFVRDGHHRISAARVNGQIEIEAEVVEVQSPVTLTVEDFGRNGWFVKANHAGKEESMIELVELDVIKQEQAELRKQFEMEHMAHCESVSGAGVAVRLLERIGDRLIAFGTQLKANSQPVQ